MSLVVNKTYGLDYKVTERLVFGVELLGPEVKTLRAKQGSLNGASVRVVGGELFLIGGYIPVYQEKNNPKLDAYRIRKVLATKAEILRLATLGKGNNLHLVPTAFFISGRKIKLEVGIATHLKKHDKRNLIKQRDLNKRGQ